MSRQRNHGAGRGGASDRIADLATLQGGVVSLDQLRGEGISRRLASERAQASSLHRVHRGVYAVGHRSISQAALLRAAVLACGEGAVVSHATAAAFWELQDRWPRLIDVTVPVEAGRKIEGIRCRRCRYPAGEEVIIRRGVPCTTPARTLIDLAGIWGIDSLRKAVERAALLKRLDLDALDLAIHNAKRRRGLRILQMVVADWRTRDGKLPDVRSDFEALVFPRLRALGLPVPACNVKIRTEDGILMVDFLWEDQRLVLETDGGETHETPVAFQRDRRRDQLLLASGYRVMRATWKQIHDDLDGVATRIMRALSVSMPRS